jgi:hypothetical protein
MFRLKKSYQQAILQKCNLENLQVLVMFVMRAEMMLVFVQSVSCVRFWSKLEYVSCKFVQRLSSWSDKTKFRGVHFTIFLMRPKNCKSAYYCFSVSSST